MTAGGDEVSSVPEGVLLGCGNPLLDLQAVVPKEFLDKWGLKENDAILCDDKHNAMFDELSEKFQVEYIPGGATQNAVRVAQWILKTPNRTVFFGAIGNDKFGAQLREKATAAGVNVQYQVNGEVKTGTCAALIHGQHRSLCAHLAAANTFTVDHIHKAENQTLIKKAKYFYIAGFFLTVCPPALMEIAKHAHDNGKVFMLNLAAPFISQFFYEPLSQALPYVDILFGNEDEGLAFSKASNFETEDLKEIALKAAALPRAEGSTRPRIVIITQGGDPILVASEGKLIEYPVNKLPADRIVDTNGAGDAFVGGFLAKFVEGKSVAEAIECGNYAAAEIIQLQGCTVPQKCKYHF